jgi:hypothetical protein
MRQAAHQLASGTLTLKQIAGHAGYDVRARDGNGDAVYYLRFSGDADDADTHPTLVRPDRCKTIYVGTGDCGRLTHERGGYVATNGDRFGHRSVKRHGYTSWCAWTTDSSLFKTSKSHEFVSASVS